MSIATKRGDGGQTSLIGNRRLSKAHARVEACGCLDELSSQIGFARAICDHTDTRALLADLQRQLFLVSEEVASGGEPGAGSSESQVFIEAPHVDALTRHVQRLEGLPGLVGDWSLPGGHPAGAAVDVARTVCRRAERALVRLGDSGEPVGPNVLAFMNRLGDLLWLLGRAVELAAGADARLREDMSQAPRWSRAWSREPLE